MTDKYFAKSEFKIYDVSLVEKVTKTGQELLREILSRHPDVLEANGYKGIDSKVLYRCC